MRSVITTRFGNASVEDTTRNALAVAELFGIEAPVYRGAAEPLGKRLGEGFPAHVILDSAPAQALYPGVLSSPQFGF